MASGGAGQGGTSTGGAGGHLLGATGGVPMSGSPCHQNIDCGTNGALTCRAPGEFLGCGTCRQGPGTCGTDADCAGSADAGAAGPHMICDHAPSTDCYCNGVMTCQAGCRANTDCPSGQSCNTNHHCQTICTPGPSGCPANYTCGSDGFCAQNSCTSDAACSGACVKGKCYDTAGSCAYRPA